jgi:hypothetical protein
VRALAVCEIVDDQSERGQTFVDGFRFFESVTSGTGFGDLFATSQIDQVEFAGFAREIDSVVLGDGDDEARVAS